MIERVITDKSDVPMDELRNLFLDLLNHLDLELVETTSMDMCHGLYSLRPKSGGRALLRYLNEPQLVTKSCGCIFCDLDIELREDEQGFHHQIKSKRIACTAVKS